jgi:phosphoglycolate phosphatase
MAIKLIIFDLDGTLIDSSTDICHAINHATEGTGIRPVSVQETVTLIGEGISKLFEKLIENGKVAIDKEPLVARFLDYYSAHVVDHTPVYPGVEATLKELADYRKVIVSNKREDLSTRALESLGIASYFDFIAGSDSTPARKPSPVPIQFVLAKYGIATDEAVIVGDSNYDIEAGRAAGIKTIAVTYGYRPVFQLQGADFRVNSMPEIVPIIKKLDR